MSNKARSNAEILRDKVVILVKDFVREQGGITVKELEALFGPHYEVITALYKTLKLC